MPQERSSTSLNRWMKPTQLLPGGMAFPWMPGRSAPPSSALGLKWLRRGGIWAAHLRTMTVRGGVPSLRAVSLLLSTGRCRMTGSAPCSRSCMSTLPAMEAWRVYADVEDALRDLSADHQLLVVSNFDGRLRRILRGHGLDRWFKELIISSEVGCAKPDPGIFRMALTVAGCQPSEALHIGDDERFDEAGPRAVGMHTFRVDRPAHGLEEAVEKVRSGAFPACVPQGTE